MGAALRSRLRHARYSLIFYDGTPSEVPGTAPSAVPGTAPSAVPGTAPFYDGTPGLRATPSVPHLINLIREHAPSAVRVRLHSGPAVHSGPAAATSTGESWAAALGPTNEKESPSNELDNDDVVLTLTEAVARTLVSAGVAAATPAAGWLIPRLRELALSRGGSRH